MSTNRSHQANSGHWFRVGEPVGVERSRVAGQFDVAVSDRGAGEDRAERLLARPVDEAVARHADRTFCSCIDARARSDTARRMVAEEERRPKLSLESVASAATISACSPTSVEHDVRPGILE